MFRCISFLQWATRSRGTFMMEFDCYSEVPQGMVDSMLQEDGR